MRGSIVIDHDDPKGSGYENGMGDSHGDYAQLEVVSTSEAKMGSERPSPEEELLNSGVQYKIYLIPGERVRKVPTTVEEAAEKLSGWSGEGLLAPKEYVTLTKRNEKQFKDLLQGYPEAGEYLEYYSILVR